MAPWTVSIDTPQSAVVALPARWLRLTTTVGELALLPGHAELVAEVVPGVATILAEAGEEPLRVLVAAGYLRAWQQGVELTVGGAEEVASIDRAQAAAALAAARADPGLSGDRADPKQAALRLAEARWAALQPPSA